MGVESSDLDPADFSDGLRGIHWRVPSERRHDDAGIFMLIAFVFVLATASLVVTWCSRADGEPEWQATLGRRR